VPPKGRPFAKGNPGRQPGTRNKITLSAKMALEAAFDGIGGVQRMQAWADENPTEFYRIWSKVLPKEITGTGEGGKIEIVIRRASS
jgi:hypothetical protein